MGYSECFREKLSQYKIEGQSKPFVDKDLQLQLPGCDSPGSTSRDFSFNPIYSHYMGSCCSSAYLPSQINEAEIYRAITEAQLSYESWKHMQQSVYKTVKAALS